MKNSIRTLFLVPSALALVSLAHAKPPAVAPAHKPHPTFPPPPAAALQVKAFPSVKASDPAVKAALPATNLTAAKAKVGQTLAFTGTVSKIYETKGGGLRLINFGKDYKTAVVGMVSRPSWTKFGSMKNLSGQKVWIKGKVLLYKGAPQVELTAPGDIKVIH